MDDVELLKAALRVALELAATRQLQIESLYRVLEQKQRALDKAELELRVLKDTVCGMETTRHRAVSV